MISIENICKNYEDKILFNKFCLEIPDDSFLVIHGNSGCGKTTLLNMIGGIELIDSGKIYVDGIDITNKRNKRKYYRDIVGFLFQNFALLENKTVRQNLELVKKECRTNISIEKAIEKVGLCGMLDKKIYKLSGGEQQRVALARLMIKKCNLILADEPTGSLDEDNSDKVMKILHEFAKMGKTVIVVTHSKKIVNNEKFVVDLSN